jgi:hypothetical protein
VGTRRIVWHGEPKRIDGEAIAKAVTKQNTRFVPIKRQEQLDVQPCTESGIGWCNIARR